MKRATPSSPAASKACTSDDAKTCSWCPNPRSRADLCDKCRQKVESRARRLCEQKLKGDVVVMDQISSFLQQHVADDETYSDLSASQFITLLSDILPFLLVRFQAEMRYSPTKRKVWTIAESNIRMICNHLYTRTSTSSQSFDRMNRSEMCLTLEDTILTKMQNYHNTQCSNKHSTSDTTSDGECDVDTAISAVKTEIKHEVDQLQDDASTDSDHMHTNDTQNRLSSKMTYDPDQAASSTSSEPSDQTAVSATSSTNTDSARDVADGKMSENSCSPKSNMDIEQGQDGQPLQTSQTSSSSVHSTFNSLLDGGLANPGWIGTPIISPTSSGMPEVSSSSYQNIRGQGSMITSGGIAAESVHQLQGYPWSSNLSVCGASSVIGDSMLDDMRSVMSDHNWSSFSSINAINGMDLNMNQMYGNNNQRFSPYDTNYAASECLDNMSVFGANSVIGAAVGSSLLTGSEWDADATLNTRQPLQTQKVTPPNLNLESTSSGILMGGTQSILPGTGGTASTVSSNVEQDRATHNVAIPGQSHNNCGLVTGGGTNMNNGNIGPTNTSGQIAGTNVNYNSMVSQNNLNASNSDSSGRSSFISNISGMAGFPGPTGAVMMNFGGNMNNLVNFQTNLNK